MRYSMRAETLGTERATMTDSRLSQCDQAEIERSATEASKVVLKPLERAQIDRYLDPPADTAYGLEYAFHLLGDVRGKTVLDLGCGTGENIVPLLERGARVIGIDISPDLIAIAQKRSSDANLEASVMVGSAYETGLPDESVDVIFCMALIHHLDIKLVRDEMLRVLRKGGAVILREPVRFQGVCLGAQFAARTGRHFGVRAPPDPRRTGHHDPAFQGRADSLFSAAVRTAGLPRTALAERCRQESQQHDTPALGSG